MSWKGNDSTPLTTDEIGRLIQRRAQHRLRGDYSAADALKQTLWEAGVELMDSSNPLATRWMLRREPERPKVVAWSSLVGVAAEMDQLKTKPKIPLIVNTVDTPVYRQRYNETCAYLERWLSADSLTTVDAPLYLETCHLLNLLHHPTIGAKGILIEGWRTVLIPRLMLQFQQSDNNNTADFVLVAEDDIRFPHSVSPAWLVRQCRAVFQSHPDVHLLSLGHSWSQIMQIKVTRTDWNTQPTLLDFLRRKPTGLHATTLLAVRLPQGIQALHQALLGTGNKSVRHWDQYLFHSTQHNLALAVSDPPLAGWTEVSASLSKAGSGHRRKGGGRWGCLPPVRSDGEVLWVRRCTQDEGSKLE